MEVEEVAAPVEVAALVGDEGRESVAVAGGELTTVGPLKPEGKAFAETRGWRCKVGCPLRDSPQRCKHSSLPSAMLSGI